MNTVRSTYYTEVLPTYKSNVILLCFNHWLCTTFSDALWDVLSGLYFAYVHLGIQVCFSHVCGFFVCSVFNSGGLPVLTEMRGKK